MHEFIQITKMNT